MTVQIALYRGPTSDWQHAVAHWVTCAVLSIRHLRWCPYSHAELVIDGICYSSSVRDDGVRDKVIDLTSGKWVLHDVAGASKEIALARFAERKDAGYDWPGALRWGIPFLRERAKADYCFELVAYMLGLPEPSDWSPLDLADWADMSMEFTHD